MALITNNPGQLNFGSPGDTVSFVGTHILDNVNFPGDRTYIGPGKLTGGSGWTIRLTNVSNFTFRGLLFDNANVKCENCRNFTFDTPFRNLKGRGGEMSHAIFLAKCSDFNVKGDFKDMYGADTCVFAWDIRNAVISDGRYENVHEAIHVFWYSFPSVPWNCRFERNVIKGIRRHGIELQGCAHGCYVKRNHVSGRIANGINLSIATGGEFGNGGYETTRDIEVDDNVLDNTGFRPSHYSQCMGIELMGRAKCRNNFIENSGQAIAVTYNSPDTIISGNRFKNPTKNDSGQPVLIVADPPTTRYIQPRPENFTDNVIYTGAMPTAEETVGGTPPTPTPTPTPVPTFTLKATPTSNTDVRFEWSGLPANTARVNIASITTAGREFGPAFNRLADPPNHLGGGFNTNWNYDFSAVALAADGGVLGQSNTITDVKVIAPPTPPPPPPPPPPPAKRKVVKTVLTFDDGETQTLP